MNKKFYNGRFSLVFLILFTVLLLLIFGGDISFKKLKPEIFAVLILLLVVTFNFLMVWFFFFNKDINSKLIGVDKRIMIVLNISGYIFSAILFYFILYKGLYIANSNHFNNPSGEELGNFDLIYFTIVTFATVGYGDIYPKSTMARGIVTLEILNSIFIITLLIANVGLLKRILPGIKNKS